MEKIDFNPKELIDRFLETGDERYLDLIKANIGDDKVLEAIYSIMRANFLTKDQKQKRLANILIPEIIKKIKKLSIENENIACMTCDITMALEHKKANSLLMLLLPK